MKTVLLYCQSRNLRQHIESHFVHVLGLLSSQKSSLKLSPSLHSPRYTVHLSNRCIMCHKSNRCIMCHSSNHYLFFSCRCRKFHGFLEIPSVFLAKWRLPVHCMRGSRTVNATMKQLTYHFFPSELCSVMLNAVDRGARQHPKPLAWDFIFPGHQSTVLPQASVRRELQAVAVSLHFLRSCIWHKRALHSSVMISKAAACYGSTSAWILIVGPWNWHYWEYCAAGFTVCPSHSLTLKYQWKPQHN